MSSFNAFGLFMVVGILYIYVRFFLDRLVRDRADAVVTGVIRGVSVPTKHRWLVLQNSWLPAIAALIVFDSATTLGWILLGRNAGAEEAKLFAYLLAFLSFTGGTLGAIAQSIVWYPRLASILRQAEAD